MGDLPASLQRARAAAFRSQAIQLAEQAPGPAPLAARDRWQDVQVRPAPRVRQGDYARERQYRVEGARDQFMHGRTLGDRVGAAGTLAANVLPAVAAFPPARQAFRAAQAGDWQSAATEGGQAALQIAGAGVPARGPALLGRMSRAAPAARAGEAATEAPRPIPLAIRPQMRASDGSILPAQPRETFGRPFSNTAGTSADLREAARSGGPMRLYRGSTSGDPQIRPNSYWSKDPAYASRQAMGQGVSEGQSVIPADATFRNPYHVRDARESGMVEVPETGGGAAWIESLRARGHDAIIDDIGNQVYVLDANSVQPAIRQQAAASRPQHDPMQGGTARNTPLTDEFNGQVNMFVGPGSNPPRTSGFVGPDGIVRHEISDANAALRPDGMERLHAVWQSGKGEVRLSEVLDHPELYQEYPWLRNTRVGGLTRGSENAHVRRGVFGPRGDRINFDFSRARAPDEQLETLLHEVQHIVQHKRGTARGGYPDLSESTRGGRQATVWNTAGEVEAFDVSGRRKLSLAEREATPPRLTNEDVHVASYYPYLGERLAPLGPPLAKLGAGLGGMAATATVLRRALEERNSGKAFRRLRK